MVETVVDIDREKCNWNSGEIVDRQDFYSWIGMAMLTSEPKRVPKTLFGAADKV